MITITVLLLTNWRNKNSDSDIRGLIEHVVATITNTEDVLLGKYEMILKDRTRYYRESTPRNPEVYGEWRVHGTNVPRAFSLPCLNPGSFEQGAPGSSDEPQFTSETFLSEDRGSRCGTSSGPIPQGVPRDPVRPSFRRNMTE